MTQIQLENKIKDLPPNLKNEVYDFIEFLLSKTKQNKNKIIPKFGSAKGKIIFSNKDETKKKKKRVFGYAKNSIKLSKDFDNPLDEFKDYM